MKKFIIPIAIMLIGAYQVTQANIYKWTDEEGKVHYSATPPKKPQKNVEDIAKKIKANIGKTQPVTRYQPEPNQPSEKSNQQAQAAQQNKSQDKYHGDRTQARIAYCNGLKSNIHTMENNKDSNLVRDGETKPMTKAQIESQIKKDKASLAKDCIGLG